MRPRLAIVYSTRDPAGTGTARRLLRLVGGERSSCPLAAECHILSDGTRLAGYEADTIELEFIDDTPDPQAEAVIVLSRHSAQSGKPSLTTHHTGNPTSRTLGGEPEKLSISAPPLSKALLKAYLEEAEERGLLGEYEITLEATHHGPTRPSKPLVFIEIGSTPDRWRDPRAQEAMAHAVARVLEHGLAECTPAAGFGEPHYPVKFTKIHLETEYCMGHIIPRYALPETPEHVIREAVEKTWPARAGVAFIHKKSLKAKDRQKLIALLESLGVEVNLV